MLLNVSGEVGPSIHSVLPALNTQSWKWIPKALRVAEGHQRSSFFFFSFLFFLNLKLATLVLKVRPFMSLCHTALNQQHCCDAMAVMNKLTEEILHTNETGVLKTLSLVSLNDAGHPVDHHCYKEHSIQCTLGTYTVI